jgi:hypothetical protein
MLVNQILKSWEGLLERNWCGDESPRDRKLKIFLEIKLIKWQRRPYWESDGNPFLSYNMDKELWYFLVRCKYIKIWAGCSAKIMIKSTLDSLQFTTAEA